MLVEFVGDSYITVSTCIVFLTCILLKLFKTPVLGNCEWKCNRCIIRMSFDYINSVIYKLFKTPVLGNCEWKCNRCVIRMSFDYINSVIYTCLFIQFNCRCGISYSYTLICHQIGLSFTYRLLARCGCVGKTLSVHDDVIKWKHFPRNWPFVRGIVRSRWIPHT